MKTSQQQTAYHLENDSRFIPAHQQPALLIDMALSRGIDTHRLLKNTGIFYEDILKGELLISPEQYARLIGNIRKLLPARDTSFLFGHRMFPGNYGPATEALLKAGSLQQMLEILCQHHLLTSPLITPVMVTDDHACHISFIDNCGNTEHWPFLLEATMAGISHLSRWLSGDESRNKYPWEFSFSHKRPEYIEQYEVNFGSHLKFDAQVDGLSIPKEYLFRPWPNGSHTAFSIASRQAEEQTKDKVLLLEDLYRYLSRESQSASAAPSLEQCADYFGFSSATLKRKLKKHRTNFKFQQDRVCKQIAIYLLQHKGYTNDQVAAYLNYGDVNNFRRSFKRWTGMTPSLFRLYNTD